MSHGSIWVNRVGEQPHVFTLDEIEKGAIKESGLFPELYQSDWQNVVGIDITGVERKHREHITAVRNGGYNLPLYLPHAAIPQAFEDSKEAEKDQAKIAAEKAKKGFISPFRKKLESRKGDDRERFITKVEGRIGTSIGKLIGISDDRNQVGDSIFLDPAYGPLFKHWNPQVREIFAESHEVPGKRVKEVTSALYGVANSEFVRGEAAKVLDARGVPYDSSRTMDTTLSISSVIPGGPMGDTSLIVRAEGFPYAMRQVDDQIVDAIQKGRIISFDDFMMVQTDEHPDGISMAQLKEDHPNHKYFSTEFSPGRALTAFAEMVEIPKLDNRKPLYPGFNAVAKQPRTVVSNIPMISAPVSQDAVLESLPLPTNMRLSNQRGGLDKKPDEPAYGGFKTLRELEKILHSGQAFVIQDPDKFEIPDDHGILGKDGQQISNEEVKLLRQLETDLMFAYLITMSTQSGAPNHFGRAHMVEKSYWEKRGKWHSDFCNIGLTGDVETEAFRWFSNEKELASGLNDWDRMAYKHQVPTPANDFMKSEKEMLDILGIDPGYVFGGYGSASSYIDNTHKDAAALFYELSKYDDLTSIDGGGTRSSMLGMREGVIKAEKEGYEVMNVGVRSEDDVSPLEGDIEAWVKDKGYDVDPDAKGDERHISFNDDQFHVLKLNRLLQRQAAIAALSDSSVFFPGGKGTVVEAAITRLHNARVRIFGEGLFPGFSNIDQIKPMIFVDHEFDYLGEKRGVFDNLNKIYEGMDDFFGVQVFKGDDRIERAKQAVLDHARQVTGLDIALQVPANDNSEPQIDTEACAPSAA